MASEPIAHSGLRNDCPGEIKNKGYTHFWGMEGGGGGVLSKQGVSWYHGRCADGEFQRNEGPTWCFIPFDLQFVSQSNPSLTKSYREKKGMIRNGGLGFHRDAKCSFFYNLGA